jgi:hypothetical protein
MADHSNDLDYGTKEGNLAAPGKRHHEITVAKGVHPTLKTPTSISITFCDAKVNAELLVWHQLHLALVCRHKGLYDDYKNNPIIFPQRGS